MISHIAYLSTQSFILNDSDLESLLQHARTSNALLGLTGILIHLDGHFIQFIEGDQPALDQIYKKITTDPRHFDLKILSEGSSAKRCFGAWDMYYKKLTNTQLDTLEASENKKSYDHLKPLSAQAAEEVPALQLLHNFVEALS